MRVVLAILVGFFVLQAVVARAVFWNECRDEEGFWTKGRPAAKSLSVQFENDTSGLDQNGCGHFCMRFLVHPTNAMEYVEFKVDNPDPGGLSVRPGWYRYRLSNGKDPACDLYRASSGARRMLELTVKGMHAGQALSDGICVASEPISAPTAPYSQLFSVDYWKRHLFGTVVWRSELRDAATHEVVTWRKRSGYVGSLIYQLGMKLQPYRTTTETCGFPDSRYTPTRNDSEDFVPVSNVAPKLRVHEAPRER